MGYPNLQKGYRVLEISTKEFLVSRDVIFHENIFPFSEKTSPDEDSGIISNPCGFLSNEALPRDSSYVPLVQPRNVSSASTFIPTTTPTSDENSISKTILGNRLKDPTANEEI